MESYWKLRIDYTPQCDALYSRLEDDYLLKYIRVKEEPYGSNPHFHYYVETTVPQSRIRTFIRTQFGEILGRTGNKIYSYVRTEKHPIAYVAYLMKDLKSMSGLTIVGLDNIDPFIEECRIHNDKVQVSMKLTKEGKKKIWEQCMDYVNEHRCSFSNFKGEIYPLQSYKHHIVRYVLQFYKEKKILIRKMQLVNVIDTILIHSASTVAANGMEAFLMEKTI